VRAAVRDVAASPSTWLVAAAGFLARGGILVLAVPVLSLPTPVGVTLLVPPLSVTTSGVAAAFVPQLVVAGAALVVAAAAALVLGALADAVCWQRIGPLAGSAADPATDESPAAVTAPLVGKLVAVELLALLPAAIAAALAASRLIAVGEQEYLLPSSLDVPYVVRVLGGASQSVIALAACLLLADVVNALVSRRVLRRAFRVGRSPAILRPRRGLRRVVRIAATWISAWVVTLVSLLPGLAAIELAWPGARDAYTATIARDQPGPAVLFAVTVIFVAAWAAAVLVAGLGSSIRTVLWSFATVP